MAIAKSNTGSKTGSMTSTKKSTPKYSFTSRTTPTNKPSLKSQGAGYSTTNRKGETTFYKSSKDASGYSDTRDGKNVPVSAGKPLSRYDATGNIINADAIKPNTPITLPTPAPVQGMTNVTDTINASLATLGGGTYDPKTKQIQSAPVKPENQFQDILQQYMGANAQAFGDMPTAESRLKAQQKMLRPKENLVNSLQGQINTITANRDAEMLKLEGQGRGITESIIGGQQAQISREAAIQAMPIQAQLAIAQDDLDSARSYASQLFQAQSQDAQAKYAFQKEINGTIFNYLNEEQKRVLAQKEKTEDRAFQVEQKNRDLLKQLSMQAIEFGQSGLAGEIMRKDPASPTFDSEYGDALSRLRKPVSATSGNTNQMSDNERALMTQFRGEQIVKDYNEILSQKGTIDAYIANGVGGPADLALVFSFMKGLDPTSVVREAEYDTAAKSGNIFQGAFSKFNGYFKEKGGFLPDNVKQEFQNLVNQKLAVKESQYKNVVSQYNGIAERQGLNPQNVVIDYAQGGYTPPLKDPNEAIFDSVVGQETQNQGLVPRLWRWLTSK